MKSERVGRFRKLAGSEFQTVRAIKTERKVASTLILRLRLGIRAERSRKVRGKCTVEVTSGKSSDLVFAAEFHRQPMEFIQQ